MTLLPSIDAVVRQYMPTVLDAAGKDKNAQRLRELEPVLEIGAIRKACFEIKNLSITHDNPVWVYTIDDFAFWIEAALWAAIRNDFKSFEIYVNQANAVLLEGLDQLFQNRLLLN
jgi:hypothetical protein